ncbi:TRAP transporter substrate-binding protein [Crassaminicella profunda]|uniref:TRAP transporter substrate-binding protein n=1 Tax=Crassaminicella profunda TaxID=1286698 RepID=UPI001CA6414C|nr:TRAP transporter substrate-binding protein [Crassaminicella profunda]QZY54674.1 TRAP transporter substrate-binding protein DctP [Crassaminicella profunda]
MFKKLISVLVSILLVGALFTGCGQNTAKEEDASQKTEEQSEQVSQEQPKDQIVLRFAESHVDDYPTTKADKEFARLVEERTNGRIKVEVYPGNQLGEEKATIEQVQFGGIDFTRVSLSPLTNFSPKLNVLTLPYLYRDSEHMWKVLNGEIGQEFLDSLGDSGFTGLCFYESGARSFYNAKREIKTIEDLKGLKIRTMESKLMVSLLSSLGVSPTPMPHGETYSALQTGVIDGAENNIPTYESSSQYEVAKYYTVDEHTRVPDIVVASKMTMDKLSKEDQEIIKQAAKDSIKLQRKLWNQKVKESEEKVVAAGCKITKLDPVEKEKFVELVQPIYDEFAADYKDIVQKIKDVK